MSRFYPRRPVAQRGTRFVSRLLVGFCVTLGCVSLGCGKTESTTASTTGGETDEIAGTALEDTAKELDTVPSDSILAPEAGESESPSKTPPEKLGIGDKNPGLEIAQWVKGEPVEGELNGKVHVVEFWATWCGPCRVGMPHISELQEKYADQVTFIGVTREDQATVEGFLASDAPSGETWDDVIKYRLALDDDSWTNTAYMRAANQNGIPCAFVVGYDGVVEWIGHPGSIDEPLEKIVSKEWNREEAIAEYRRSEKLKEASAELNRLARAGEWDKLLKVIDGLEEETGKSQGLSSFRLQILLSAGRTEAASKLRAQLVEDAWDNANTLNELAWRAATESNAQDLDIALKAATRASSLREGKDPSILDTLARCYYEIGDLDEAIKWQKLAAENNNGNRSIDASLNQYIKEKAAADAAEEAPAEENSEE